MSSKILFVVTNHGDLGGTGRTGWHSVEIGRPLQILRAAGLEVDFASPAGGKAPMSPYSENYDDPINARFLFDQDVQAALAQTRAVSDLDADHYRALYLVGGHGALWDFPDCQPLADLAVRIYEKGGLVATIGQGAAGLLNARLSNGKYLIEGKKITAFSTEEERALKLDEVVPILLEDRLRERGAKFVQGESWQPFVVTGERLLSGQNPASAQRLGEALGQALTEARSRRVAEAAH